jgi:DNA oxidative demethylase
MAAAARSRQAGLFDTLPPGLAFQHDFVTTAEEVDLLARVGPLPFAPFQFHGWEGRRETVSFGWRYDFNDASVHPAPPIPDFLLPLRTRAAGFAGLEPAALEQALIIRYGVGAGIGWHRDRPVFDRVVGISLLSETVLRLRRRLDRGFERFPLHAPPRSVYLLTGAVRHEWEHSIAPVEEPRFSITFRSVRPGRAGVGGG